MKERFIIGNWKSNKTVPETIAWLRFMKEHKAELEQLEQKDIIICASYTLLYTLHSFIKEYALPIKIGAQDISPFDAGAYTGEVHGAQIKEFADYVIIGHSERRKYFHEDDDLLAKKVTMAKKYELNTIYCVPDDKTSIPDGVPVVAYEPVFAIGSGTPDTPENAEAVITSIKRQHDLQNIIYGGSVTGENVASFTNQQSISGVLPGGASLDPQAFLSIIQHA